MSGPIVTINQGQLKGKIEQDHYGGDYCTFFNIPYAKPPLGNLRFKAPQPPEGWTGIRDATTEGEECYSKHMIFQNYVGSEDCLILNVFTPELPKNSNNLKPVMVWIHGGGFVSGSSKIEMYGPQFIVSEDVVVVTINYRLGVLGFLSLEDPKLEVPGNAGLKDMVMALKWVKGNIKEFNGDPNNVTIFGESAGGAAVHYLMLSPMAKGLFHRAIAQSGCALNIWACGTRAGAELAGYLGTKTNDEKEILELLQNASKEALLEAQSKCIDPFNAVDVRPHGPVIEKLSNIEPAFLADSPVNIIMSGNYNKVPLIMGYTTREGMLFEIMERRAGVSHRITNFEKAVPYTLNMPEGSPMSRQVGQKIKEFYYGSEEPTEENIDKYYMLQTDNFFFRGIYSSIKNHLATSNTPIYFYRFSVEATLNVYKILGNIPHKGACHADDLGYLFKMFVTPQIQPDSVEYNTIKRLTKFWANFARNGNPNSAKQDDLIPIVWPEAKADDLKYIDIGDNLTIGTNPEMERMKFWDGIYAMNPATSKL